MATWLASDNILTTINMEVIQLENDLIFSPELIDLDNLQELMDTARRDSKIAADMINASANGNPLLFIGRRRWQLNAKTQRAAIEGKIERIVERSGI